MAEIVVLYAALTVPCGRGEVVEMDRGAGGLMVTVYACVPFCCGLLVSFTWIVKATVVCAVVGVPVIVAVVLLPVKDKPAGNVPLLTTHV